MRLATATLFVLATGVSSVGLSGSAAPAAAHKSPTVVDVKQTR
jgi:hypothetical protein